MKTPGLPLGAKILGWFFLNLVMLAVVAWVLLGSELRPDAWISLLAGERSTRLAETVMREIQTTRRPEWNSVLERFGEINGVTLVLFRDDGGVVAGPQMKVPAAVLERIRPIQPPRGGEGVDVGARAGQGLPRDRGRGPRPGPTEGGGPDGRPFPDDGPRNPPGPPSPEGQGAAPKSGGRPRSQGPPRQFIRTSDPTMYWMTFGMGIPGPGNRPMVPAQLAFISETFTGGGLFFDSKPWLWGAAGVIAVSVLWWLPFIHRMTRAITRLTRATEQIAEGRFDVDLGPQGSDEIGRLGGAVGLMAGKLDGFVTGQKRFLGDISHELCAPIARLQMAVGVLEMRTDEQQQAYVEDIKEELHEMSGLVNELLSFSKAGLRSRELPLGTVQLRPLVERVVERENTTGAEVRMEIPEELALQAEPDLLARALGNLVRNAVRYAGDEGPVIVSVLDTGDSVEIHVADSGPGVPDECLEKIFEPFFRIDPSRNRETGGTGLGLAIVRSCVTSFCGTVHAQNRHPRGLEVTVTLKKSVPTQA